MFRVALVAFLMMISLGTAYGQFGGKRFEVAVGQKYKPGKDGVAVAADRKQMSAFSLARQKMDAQALGELLQSGAVQYMREAVVFEVVKIEGKSAEHPTGLVECALLKDGEKQGTVYLATELFVEAFLSAADDATAKAAVLPGAAVAPKPAVTRTWKAAAGGFEVEAELVSTDGDNVVLKRKSDGKELTVAVDKFSAADRKWLEDYVDSSAEEPYQNANVRMDVDTAKVSVTAEQLAQDFATNARARFEKYLSATRVVGTVERVRNEKDENGQPVQYVELRAGKGRIIECKVANYFTEFGGSRKPGQKVAVVSRTVDLKSKTPFVVSVREAEFVKVK